MNRFQPKLSEVEDRSTPSVTPSDVFAAAAHSRAVGQNLEWLSENLNSAEVYRARGALSTLLPGVYFNLLGDKAILTEFLTSLQTTVATDPAQQGVLSPTITATVNLLSANDSYIGYSAALAKRFGATDAALTPPVPITFRTVDTTLPSINVGDPGVVTNSSTGLRTRDEVVGTGATATVASTVRVQYNGWLASDGTLFDSSARHPDSTQPEELKFTAKFPLATGVIVGFRDGIAGMKVGGIRTIFMPADQAYGANGTGGVPPNSDLVFQVVLIGIE